MRIKTPHEVSTNFEAVVAWYGAHRWKLVRTFDDPTRWADPEVTAHRDAPLPDEWELYDLTSDPVERVNRWNNPSDSDAQSNLVALLAAERHRCVPARNSAWPDHTRQR